MYYEYFDVNSLSSLLFGDFDLCLIYVSSES